MNSIQFNSIQFNSIQFNSICNNFKFYFFINSCNFINILCLFFKYSLFCYKYFYFSCRFLKLILVKSVLFLNAFYKYYIFWRLFYEKKIFFNSFGYNYYGRHFGFIL
ncbi:hypothetical protein EPJ74_02005 [Brachyspira aalborgi]|uniref:Transmembrane protein n=1 Tax=Brachyspira aalborgi TaxID=29522 RepID=A0A5C8GIK9_9SPIR|nr:hypothetical protein EPJ74_02005 [Brachyspira aalborgi]